MAKFITKDVLDLMKAKIGFYNSTALPPEEQRKYKKMLADGEPLPNGITLIGTGEGAYFVQIEKPESDEGFTEYVAMEQLKCLKTIKNIAIAAAVIFATSLVVAFIWCGAVLAPALTLK